MTQGEQARPTAEGAELRDGRPPLHSILDNVSAIVFSVDRAYRYTSFNAAHAAIMRSIYGAEVELGDSLLDCMDELVDRDKARRNLDRALAGEQFVEESFSGNAKLARRFFRISHSPIWSGDEVVGAAVVAEDATERHVAESKLQRELDRGATLLELHRKAVSLVDRDLYQLALDHAVRLTGSEIGFVHVVSPDEREVVLSAWTTWAIERCTSSPPRHAPVDEAGNWVDSLRLRRPVVYNDYPSSPNRKGLPDGHLPVRRFMSCPVVDEARVRLIVGVANKPEDYEDADLVQLELVANELQKIVRQHEAEEALRRLNRELHAISRCNEVLIRASDEQVLLDDVCRIVCREAGFRMAWVGYVEHDEAKTVRPVASTGAADGELEAAAITWAETERGMGPTGIAARTGRTSNVQVFETDPLQAPWLEGARRYGYRAAIGLPLKDAEGMTFGVLSICSADEAFSVADVALLEELAGDLAFGIGVIRARVAHAQLEAQLRQAQKMEVIGQLAGGIAHDFNNLLTAIRGYGDLVHEELPATEAQARDDVEEILAAAERAQVLTRQLLAFSRRQVLLPQVVAPGAVIGRLVGLLRRVIGEQIELTTVLEGGAALVDPGQLEQVVVNLAVNARDAMPGGGQLRIETKDIELDAVQASRHPGAQPGTYVRLSVADTGCGMDDDTLQHLFEPFFTTKPESKGTGLGLATVYGIVRQSGGFISVASTPGRGSRFEISLPRAEASTADPAAAGRGSDALQRGTETVLLVEDDPAVREFAARSLQSLGYRVLAAANGLEAIGIVADRDSPVQLVLTDMVLPGLQGTELVARLESLKPGLAALYMSGLPESPTTPVEALPEARFLAKPFSTEELARAVRAALDGGPALR